MPKSTQRCKEIRVQTKEMILRKSILYFARNGFAGTKIGELSKYIGIGQGTMYSYFESKEALFQEIHKIISHENDIKKLESLLALPLTARKKIHELSKNILAQLEKNEDFASRIVLNTQILFEQNAEYASKCTTYQSELYQCTSKLITQGQKEGSVVAGNPLKLADFYWGVVYLYSLKKLFTTQYEIISIEDLERLLLI